MVVKLGVIGCGMIAQEHLRNLNLIDNAKPIALADPFEEMLHLSGEIPPEKPLKFSNYRDLLSTVDCDAYIIATPNYTHHQIITDVLLSHKPILIEKPLCINVAQCRDILIHAQKSRSSVWVAMEYRFMPPVGRLYELSRREQFGKPLMISFREHRFPFLKKVNNWNRFSEFSGGTLVEKCCHFWDLMRLIIKSNPIQIYASGGMDVNHHDEVYDGQKPDMIDNAFAIVEFANGTRGMLDLCMFSDSVPWQEEIYVTSSQGRIDAFIPASWEFKTNPDDQESLVQYSDRESREIFREHFNLDKKILRAGSHFGAIYYQLNAFISMVAEKKDTPAVSLEDGYWAVAVGEAAEKSIVTGSAQAIEQF
ncbi:MAG: Gfo/Idh/MocA family oxidoreductase [Rhodobacteraceae bacterium]|nr:Gfo/Idh/MocA family oxidoreductase [Paracoccaceae bacterium]